MKKSFAPWVSWPDDRFIFWIWTMLMVFLLLESIY